MEMNWNDEIPAWAEQEEEEITYWEFREKAKIL
jgi:hypothetical protein